MFIDWLTIRFSLEVWRRLSELQYAKLFKNSMPCDVTFLVNLMPGSLLLSHSWKNSNNSTPYAHMSMAHRYHP